MLPVVSSPAFHFVLHARVCVSVCWVVETAYCIKSSYCDYTGILSFSLQELSPKWTSKNILYLALQPLK